jgi:hypothetical protein
MEKVPRGVKVFFYLEIMLCNLFFICVFAYGAVTTSGCLALLGIEREYAHQEQRSSFSDTNKLHVVIFHLIK